MDVSGLCGRIFGRTLPSHESSLAPLCVVLLEGGGRLQLSSQNFLTSVPSFTEAKRPRQSHFGSLQSHLEGDGAVPGKLSGREYRSFCRGFGKRLWRGFVFLVGVWKSCGNGRRGHQRDKNQRDHQVVHLRSSQVARCEALKLYKKPHPSTLNRTRGN
jgi:hypothetical protein